MESDQNIGLSYIDVKDDYPLFMLNIDPQLNDTSDENAQLSSSNVDTNCEMEEFENETKALEQCINEEEVIEELIITYERQVIEIFHEHYVFIDYYLVIPKNIYEYNY